MEIERDDKLTSPTLLNKRAPTENLQTNDGIANLEGWKHIGNFGSYVIYASGDVRRLVDPETGQVIIEYSIHVENGNAKNRV